MLGNIGENKKCNPQECMWMRTRSNTLAPTTRKRPHTRKTAMSLSNVFGISGTEFSDQPSLNSEAFHSPSVSGTPPPTGKENNWRGASITPIGILLGQTHTYLGRDLTLGPYLTSSSASCMRHAPPSKRHQQSPEHGVLLRTRTLPPARKKTYRLVRQAGCLPCIRKLDVTSRHKWEIVNSENGGRILVDNPHEENPKTQ